MQLSGPAHSPWQPKRYIQCRGHSEVSQRQQSRNVVSGVGFDAGFDAGFVSVFNGLNLTQR